MRQVFVLFLAFSYSLLCGQKISSDSEVRTMAEKFCALAQEKKWDEMCDKYLNEDAFINKIIDAELIPKQKLDDYKAVIRKQSPFKTYFKELGTLVREFSLLMVYQKKENEYYFLTRLLFYNGDLNYLDFEVIKKKEIKVADFYSFANIGKYSEILKEFSSPEIDSSSNNISPLIIIKTFKTLYREGKYNQLIKAYSGLSELQKRKKFYLITRLNSAKQINDEEYKKAIDDLIKYHPSAKGLSLMKIDKFLIEENYQKALDEVNNTDSLVGGDIYLQLYKANMNTFLENYEVARSQYERYFSQFPSDTEMYYSYISILLAYDEWGKAIDVAKNVREKYKVDVFKEFSNEEYPDFFESDKYKAYVQNK